MSNVTGLTADVPAAMMTVHFDDLDLQRTSPLTGALLRYRIRSTLHYLRGLEPSERLRLLVILGLLIFVVARWTMGRTDFVLSLWNPEEIRGEVRSEAYRLGAFLAAFLGILSFGPIWHGTDIDVLNRFPVPQRAIFGYRLTMTLINNLPLYCLAALAFLPLFWRGHPYLALESLLYLTALYVSTAIWSICWHMFAGYSVVTPAFATLKSLLAGAMVLKDRTLLLYSPFLGAVFGFGSGLSVLAGLSAISRGQFILGTVLVLLPVYPAIWAYKRAIATFEAWYYQSLAALAEGELVGELGESAPGTGYLGQWFVEKLPTHLQSLVARDLRQAWRRSRFDHIVLLTATGVFMILTLGRGAQILQSGWLWIVIWGLIAVAAGEAFRLFRTSSDAPWQWLSLPASLPRQYLARGLGVFFFPLMIFPGLVISARWSGVGWGEAFFQVLLMSVGATWVANNLALLFFRQQRLGWILYVLIMGTAYVIGEGTLVYKTLCLLVAAVLTCIPMRGLRDRLMVSEQAH